MGTKYIEPFAGSACLFFDLEPREAVLGDLNWELTESLCALQTDVEQVLAILRGFKTGERAYYAIRKRAGGPAYIIANREGAPFKLCLGGDFL